MLLKMASTDGKNLLKIKHEEASIEMLFDEVLLEVFRYLSSDDLKNATLVCKRWDNLIGETTALMKKFKLVWSMDNLDTLPENFYSTRKYQQLWVSAMDGKKVDKFITRFNMSVIKMLVVEKVTFGEELLTKICAHLPMISFLIVFKFDMGSNFSPSSTTISLSSLTFLLIMDSDIRILEHVKTDSLRTFACCIEFDDCISHVARLASFIRHCKDLERIHMNPKIIHMLFLTNDLSDAPLQLKHFNGNYPFMKKKPFANEVVSQNFIKFLSTQAPSLDLLSLCQVGESKLPVKIYTIISEKCLDLSRLELNPNQLPSDIRFLENLTPMNRLITLLFHDYTDVEDVRPLKAFLRKCPNIAALTLLFTISSPDQLISYIARHNTRLTSLHVHEVSDRLENDLKFHNLEKFAVRLMPSMDLWLRVIANSPKLKSIEIDRNIFDSNQLATEALLTNAAVKEFNFASKKNSDKEFDLDPILEAVNKKLLEKFENSFVVFGLPPTTVKTYDSFTVLKRFFEAAGVTQNIENHHFKVLHAVNSCNGTESQIQCCFWSKEIMQNILSQIKDTDPILAEYIIDIDTESSYRRKHIGISTQLTHHSRRLMEEASRH